MVRNQFFGDVFALKVILAFTLSLFVLTDSFAQTAEQLQQLNTLPASQRQAIMQQMGIGPFQQNQMIETQPMEFPDLVDPLPGDINITGEEIDVIPLPRLAPGDTVTVQFAVIGELVTPDQELTLDQELTSDQELLLQGLVSGNPYVLDANGFLLLPGVSPIQIAGLTVEEAMIRVGAEPALVWLQPLVTFLPLQSYGIESLEPFGYDLFSGVPTTFAPATDVPVPSEYIMGPGDVVNVLLFGNNNAQYRLVVSREGAINFPEIGPISVVGLSFRELQVLIEQIIEEQMIGVSSSVTLGELRSIRVFVLGDVQRPGSYTVSGLSTLTNALFVSGGINDIGSLRQIELRREGQTVSTLDLYDLLLKGDTSRDIRLQPGDVIFAPPVGERVSIYGEILRPAVYELKEENNIQEFLSLAGGLTPNADTRGLRLERIVSGGTTVLDIDLDIETGELESLQDGDILIVPPKLEQLDNAVRLSGNVFQPGLYSWHEGLALSDLINSVSVVKPGSDLSYVLIRREVEANLKIEVFSVDLQSIWANPQGSEDFLLQSKDTIFVFDRLNSRESVVSSLLNELEHQTIDGQSVPIVSIGGEVRLAGDYPLEPNMVVLDLIKAAGGFKDSAYRLEAELIRSSIGQDGIRQTSLITIDLNSLLAEKNPIQNIPLASYDFLTVKVMPNWSDQESIEILGEVNFPGTYQLVQDETLLGLVARAGGLTEDAFVDGAVFVREQLREREAQQLEELADRLEADLQNLAADPQNSQAVTAGAALVTRLRNTEAVGRLVIDINEIMNNAELQDIVLRPNDQLYIPPFAQEITVLGEVQYPTSHIFVDELDRDSYILMSGGITENANENRIYTVRANGSVEVNNRTLWLGKSSQNNTIRPGDTIIVPVDTSVPIVPTIATATQIIYNMAIAAAAVNSF